MTLQTISWEKAWLLLKAILPDAGYFSPFHIIDVAEKANKRIRFLRELENDLNGDYDDLSVLNHLKNEIHDNESVVLVTDCCFEEHGSPFTFHMAESEEFAKEYRRQSGQMVFSGSDVILIIEAKSILVFSHENNVAVIE